MSERISVNPNICHGQACVKGTRIPVHQIIRMLANGDRIDQLLDDYPSLKAEDIYACLDYAASLAEEQITPIDSRGKRSMKILVDENIPATTVTELREQGHDVLDIRGTSDQGMADQELWQKAVQEATASDYYRQRFCRTPGRAALRPFDHSSQTTFQGQNPSTCFASPSGAMRPINGRG